MIKVTPELLARYDRPGPRYTSYPTAVEFREDFGPAQYAERLAEAAGDPEAALSLYVHLPFCEARCSFCGCHVVVARRRSVADVYLDRVIAEADLLAQHLGERRTLAQYHWGGGTPTYYSPGDLARLHKAILRRFEPAPGAEVALEVDPRVTTVEHLEALRELGFNRLSLGVQDCDAVVQDLIGRHQSWEQTHRFFESARSLGFSSINVDLIYGLPGQSEASFADTIEKMVGLRPDRLAVYSFAYVPWVRPNQKRIDPETLPDRDLKFALLAQVMEGFTSAGYRQIGMDHFALPDDELAIAADEGTLHRNFMGYTTKRDAEMVALGTSGISDVAGAYAQNHKRLASYYRSVDAGELPVERGVVLSFDDRVRRYVITELMCNSRVSAAQVELRFSVNFAEYFADELTLLATDPGLDGLVEVGTGEVRAVGLGELFIRNVAMAFDAYLKHHQEKPQPVFSRTL
ncbi:MAG: oxygen-independent coproporphyrinogen III oxidase [Actinomycetota bacterium]